MDSLTQIALGAAVGVAVMGRHAPVRRAAAWGAVAGTLPDLDVLVAHGDPVLDMVLHRAHSHSLFWLTLLALPLGAAVARLHGQGALWRRWALALGAALVTHPLLDWFTVYGTQLLQPFTDHPFGLGSVFIIDPAVTLPWLAGTAWALARAGGPKAAQGLRANLVGLGLGTAYLAAGLALQAHVGTLARAQLQAQGLPHAQVLVTPAPFTTALWRIVATDGTRYVEGWRALADEGERIDFRVFDQGAALQPLLGGLDPVRRIQAFSGGFWRLREEADGRFTVTDLRLGQEGGYVFRFAVARREGAAVVPLTPTRQIGQRGDVGAALRWWWRRLQGERLPPPG